MLIGVPGPEINIPVYQSLRIKGGGTTRMDVKALKKILIKYSQSIGIDKIGFTTASTFDELKNRLLKQRELGYQSGFEEPDIEKRTNPALLLNPIPRVPLFLLL